MRARQQQNRRLARAFLANPTAVTGAGITLIVLLAAGLGAALIASDTRAPYMTRVSTSRPKESVPNGCTHEGGEIRLKKSASPGP